MKNENEKVIENPESSCLTDEGVRFIFEVLTNKDFDVLAHGWEWTEARDRLIETWTVYLNSNFNTGHRRSLLQACLAAKEELERRGKN